MFSHSAFALRHSAFTFIEVLFAVILLGIGFIMIAAVFPVAIQQTTAVSDETQGTAIARDAIKQIQNVADSMVTGASSTATLFPATGPAANIYSFYTPTPTPGALINALGSDTFFTADHRFGWVGFYRRDLVTSPFAQVFVIALQNPNFVNYRQGTVSTFGSIAPATTGSIPAVIPPPVPPNTYGYPAPQKAQIQAQFFQDPAGAWGIEISYPSPSISSVTPNGVTGAFVLIANGNYVGRFLRLSSNVPTGIMNNVSGLSPLTGGPPPQDFYLQPGWDFTPADLANPNLGNPTGTTTQVWMMGAAPIQNPSNSAADASNDFTAPPGVGGYSGPNQDIGVATGFIRVNTTNN